MTTRTLAFSCVVFLIVLSGQSLAAVADLRHYRLGEVDAVKVALGPGDNPIQDSSSAGIDAAKIDLTFFHGKSGGVGPATSLGLAQGSS